MVINGCSKFSNRLDDIKIIIDKFRPHLFSITEANYDLSEKITIDNYWVEMDNMKIGNSMARTILLIDKQINYTRLVQYDYKGIFSVCVKLLLSSKIIRSLLLFVGSGNCVVMQLLIIPNSIILFIGTIELLT